MTAKPKVRYMHTIDERPGEFDGRQVVFATLGRPLKLARSLFQVRKEQKASLAFRRRRCFTKTFEMGYRLVRLAVLLIALALPAAAQDSMPEIIWLHVTTKKPLAIYGPTEERFNLRVEKISPLDEQDAKDDVFPHWVAGTWFHGVLPVGSKIRITRLTESGIPGNRNYIPYGVVTETKSTFKDVELRLEDITEQMGNDYRFKDKMVEESLEP